MCMKTKTAAKKYMQVVRPPGFRYRWWAHAHWCRHHHWYLALLAPVYQGARFLCQALIGCPGTDDRRKEGVATPLKHLPLVLERILLICKRCRSTCSYDHVSSTGYHEFWAIKFTASCWIKSKNELIHIYFIVKSNRRLLYSKMILGTHKLIVSYF